MPSQHSQPARTAARAAGVERTLAAAGSTPGHLRVVHATGYDPGINSLYVPAIKVLAGTIVFVSGVTAAPVYHDHPHRDEDFRDLPLDAGTQARLTYAHLDDALRAAGCEAAGVVCLTRFLTDIAADQDVINRVQAEYFGLHLPTSTTVEVKRLATDPRLRLEIQAIAVETPPS